MVFLCITCGLTAAFLVACGDLIGDSPVMAAAFENPKGSGNIYSKHLSRAREIVSDKLWFLIPGIGKQGGATEQTIQAAYVGPGSIAINSSSAITLATQEDDYERVSAGKAEELRDQIRAAGGNTE